MKLLNEILIQRGETFSLDVYWADADHLTYKAITDISIADGPPRLTVPGHGMPNRWPAAVVRVNGMRQINAENQPPSSADFREGLVIDSDTIEFNGLDATGFSPYVSGGFLVFQTPQDLTDHTPRMDVKDKRGGTVLISSEEDAAPLDVIELTTFPAEARTNITISAENAAAIPWNKGVTELEMLAPDGVTVTKLKICTGLHEEPDPVRVAGEITT